jgi:tRNA threonylcarbamoyladenosine biosynthesis protein TsaB
MIILAIDTSTPRSAVALFGEDVGRETLLPPGRQASEILLPAVREILRSAGKNLSDVSRLAVCRGPGSFTGTRVGLAAGWGLSRSLSIPLELVGSLEALAETARGEEATTVCPTLDAERGELYLGQFALGSLRATELVPPSIVPSIEARRRCPAGAIFLEPSELADRPTPALAAARAVARSPREGTGHLQALYVRDL